MADESQYQESGGNKRKYDDEAPRRRATGFSSPISAPRSYNSVAPPLEGIELAKHKAQEVAARLAAEAAAEDAKRARFDDGSGGYDNGRGFSSAPSEIKPMPYSAPSAIPSSYGNYQGSSKTMDVPQQRVGVIIGRGGETIKYLQLQSGAKIQIQRDGDADPSAYTRPVELSGTPEQIAKAEQMITEVLSGAENGGSGMVSRRPNGQAGSEHFEMKVANNRVGLVIGKGGETIKSMQSRSGARIQVVPLHLPPGDTSTERSVHIDGTSEQIRVARELIEEVTSENRVRNPTSSGGYPQQGYQARPPTSWGGPPGAPGQQAGYGYMQPGAYPQQSYPGYPPQPTSGGYPGYDQSAAPPSQQTTAGSGYDYYNQQQQVPGGSSAPADASGYNYNQPPASSYPQQGQGYTQDGYGGYYAQPQSGYGQPPPYDQQQGYGSAAGYGTNPTQEGQNAAPVQGDAVQSAQPPATGPSPGSYPQGTAQPGYGKSPTSQSSYGSQPPAQSGYGSSYGPPPAQGQKTPPPVYGQTQQSPTTPGSYGQPATAQPGYPPSAYGATASAQPGYGPPPSYGAPPPAQPGYGSSYPTYGGNYAQPPPYAADGSAAPPPSRSAQPGGVTKASPQS